MTMTKTIRSKSCKVCKKKFMPVYSSTQMVCSPTCGIEYTKKLNEKTWKEKKKKMKSDLLSTSDVMKIAQHWFNKWIRYRDVGKPCISCNKPMRNGNIDAGHYFSAFNHANVRFDPDNVHAQCSRPCNKDKAGDLLNYQIGIEKRIGGEKLIELISKAHSEKKYSKDELYKIIDEYKLKCKEYERIHK